MFEPEFKGRAIIKKDIGLLEIKIPARKRIFIMLFLSVWLVGWLFGEFSALVGIFSIDEMVIFTSIFMLVWITGWTIGGCVAIIIWFWMLIGYELITIEKGCFSISKKIGLINLKKEYEIKNIKYMCVSENTSEYINRELFNFRNKIGKIKFDYGMKTIKFANDIDEAEAKMIVCELKKNHNFTESNFA